METKNIAKTEDASGGTTKISSAMKKAVGGLLDGGPVLKNAPTSPVGKRALELLGMAEGLNEPGKVERAILTAEYAKEKNTDIKTRRKIGMALAAYSTIDQMIDSAHSYNYKTCEGYYAAMKNIRQINALSGEYETIGSIDGLGLEKEEVMEIITKTFENGKEGIFGRGGQFEFYVKDAVAAFYNRPLFIIP